MQNRGWRHQPQGGRAGTGVAVELASPGGQHQRLDRRVTTDPEGDGFRTFEVTGQQRTQLIQGMGDVRAVALHSPFRPPAEARPHLRGGVLGMHEQHKAFALGTVGQQQRHRIGFIKSREIEKIAVLSERKFAVGVVGGQGCRRNHGRCRPELIQKPLPATGVNAGIELGHTAAGLS